MWNILEYVDPFDNTNPDFWIRVEHIGRYIFARNFLKRFNRKVSLVLDTGCGVGYGTKELSAYAEKVVGIDRNIEAIEYAKKKYLNRNISFINFDFSNSLSNMLSNLNVENVDLIVAFEFLEHLDDPAKTVKEFHYLLKNNGYLLCSVPNSKFESINEGGEPSNVFHKHIFTFRKISELLIESGFFIEESYGQAMTNMLLRKEIKLSRKKKISQNSSKIKYLHHENIVRYFAHMFAIPDKENIDESYSFIFIAKKLTNER